MIHVSVALFLLMTVVLGMFRIIAGPTVADRMMAAQLFGTSGLAVLMVLAWGMNLPELIDIALTFSLLAVLATMTFVRRVWYVEEKSDDT